MEKIEFDFFFFLEIYIQFNWVKKNNLEYEVRDRKDTRQIVRQRQIVKLKNEKEDI